jgi:hypothetical protein
LAKLSGGHLFGLSGIASRLSAADQLLAKVYLESRRQELNAAVEELLTRVLPRGKLGQLPIRLRQLTVFERGGPFLTMGAQIAMRFYPMAEGLESTNLLLPAGANELVLLSYTAAWWQEWEAGQAASALLNPKPGPWVKPTKWTWDPYLHLTNVHLMTKTSVSKARPLLARGDYKNRQPWAAKTPAGRSMADAFIAECERIGPGLRQFIVILVNALG